jgi:hypothetical protein
MEVCCEDVDWIDLVYFVAQWCVALIIIVNLLLP